MKSGLDLSLACLSESENVAAVATLLAAVDHAPEVVATGALIAVLDRRSTKGNRAVIQRWNQLSTSQREVLIQRSQHLESELQEAINSKDSPVHDLACEVAVGLKLYDLMAPLAEVIESRRKPASNAGAALVALATALQQELQGPRDYTRRRDPQLVRRFALTSLEASVSRYSEHKCDEPLEAFLALAGRENATLRSIIHSERGEANAAALRILRQSECPGVLRLLLSFLDDPHTPRPILQVISSRGDGAFRDAILAKAQHSQSPEFKHNLERLQELPWLPLHSPRFSWKLFSEQQQQATARLIMQSGMRVNEKQQAIVSLIQNGQPAARRFAAGALAEFNGHEINEIIRGLLNDSDPQVKACALVQLRQRSIPGAIATLIRNLESREKVISNAARSCLQEFTFSRFLAAYDEMSAEVRRSTGALVKKVDPQAVPSTIAELHNPTRSCRLRAVNIASLLGNDPRIQTALIGCLNDSDHYVRAEAARKLAAFGSRATLEALQAALADSSVTVRDAAQHALQQLEGTQVQDDKSTIQWAALLEARIQPQS